MLQVSPGPAKWGKKAAYDRISRTRGYSCAAVCVCARSGGILATEAVKREIGAGAGTLRDALSQARDVGVPVMEARPVKPRGGLTGLPTLHSAHPYPPPADADNDLLIEKSGLSQKVIFGPKGHFRIPEGIP